MKIELWSDFACPFCYIGETAMLKALEKLNLLDDVQFEFKSFQLNVNATRQPEKNIHQLISEKYHISYDQAKASNDNVVKMASELGLNYDFDHLKPNNTCMAHEVLKLSQTLNKGKLFADVAFKAYFEQGADLGDQETLISLGEKIGLNERDVIEALEKRTFYGDVIKDQTFAEQNRITSVPFFVIDDRFAISGAQSPAYFERAIKEIISNQMSGITDLS